MNDQDRDRIEEIYFVSMCSSPVFWGVVLLVIGVAWLMPGPVSHYVWPALAIAGGVALLFGPHYWISRLERYDNEWSDRF